MATKKKTPIKKRESKKSVAPAPNLEKKRQEFQDAAARTKKQAVKKGSSEPKHHTPRKRTIIIIVAALLAVVGTVSVSYAYYFWQQSPEKIVADALVNASEASSATFDVDVNSPTRMLASVNGSYTEGRSQFDARIKTKYPGALSDVHVSAINADTSLYVKSPHVSGLVGEMLPVGQQDMINAITPVVKDQIDDKWLYIQSTDVNYVKAMTGITSCLVESARRVSSDSFARSELVEIYLRNKFFEIEETRADKNFATYELTVNKDMFNDALNDLALSRAPFGGCRAELNTLRSDKIYNLVIHLVIDKSSRTIAQATVSVSGADGMTAMITPRFNVPVEIRAPSENVRFDDIKTQLFGEVFTKEIIYG